MVVLEAWDLNSFKEHRTVDVTLLLRRSSWFQKHRMLLYSVTFVRLWRRFRPGRSCIDQSIAILGHAHGSHLHTANKVVAFAELCNQDNV